MKPKLKLLVGQATHFLKWEYPYFERYFDLVDAPDDEAILFVFGSDVLAAGSCLPARRRVVLLLPGFNYNPYHDLIHRCGMRKLVDDNYDLLLVNPGPIHEAFKDCPKLRLCPPSVNVDLIGKGQYRKKIDSLLHISADYPQKDWTRSRDIMRLTGLKHEVFPPRNESTSQRWTRKLRASWRRRVSGRLAPRLASGYAAHERVIELYRRYDGFVHVASETPPFADAKYTATLLEAGLTGCILFWHDTLGLGNDFETIFDLPLDPAQAANEILSIRQNIDVEAHSQRTSEEIHDRTNPAQVLQARFDAIMELLA